MKTLRIKYSKRLIEKEINLISETMGKMIKFCERVEYRIFYLTNQIEPEYHLTCIANENDLRKYFIEEEIPFKEDVFCENSIIINLDIIE